MSFFEEIYCSGCQKLVPADQMIEDEDDELYCAACMDEWARQTGRKSEAEAPKDNP